MAISADFAAGRFPSVIQRNPGTSPCDFSALVFSTPNSRAKLVAAHKRRGRSWQSLTFLMLPQRMRVGIRPPHNLFGEAIVREDKVR
jgi:hypothetical protein